jgi:phosphatidylglycerol:prolipoprotein diacylglycerol transferase
MYPILLELGPLKIGSYGVLLALGFLSGIWLINREFRKGGFDIEIAWDIYFLIVFGGMVGSRLLFIFENFSDFLAAPSSMIFSTTGFSVLGGYVLAFILCTLRVKYGGLRFFKATDMVAPGLSLGYAVGRFGCITAGDGCYGIPTKVAWGMHFPNGLVSTLAAKNVMLVSKFAEIFPGESIPNDICVHPTPIYEAISQIVLAGILLLPIWKIGAGKRFGFFLCWFGLSRFLVEFIRLNPIAAYGLTSNQYISMIFMVIGFAVIVRGIIWPYKEETLPSEKKSETAISQ